jgi:hypothetical protein
MKCPNCFDQDMDITKINVEINGKPGDYRKKGLERWECPECDTCVCHAIRQPAAEVIIKVLQKEWKVNQDTKEESENGRHD